MKITNKILALLLAMVMLFGASSVSVNAAQVAGATVRSTKTVSFKKKTVKLKSAKATVKGPKITWTKVSNANKYYIYRKTASTSWKKIATAKSTANSYTDSSVKNKVAKYIYTVKAVNKKGQLSQYNKSGLTIYFVKAPTMNSVTKDADNNIKVSWGKVSKASGYYVYRKKAGGEFKKIATIKNGSKATYTDKTSKTDKTKYVYTVKAYKTVSGKTYSSAYYTNGKSILFRKTINPIMADPLAAYQKAAKEINKNGVAGYKKKSWQKISTPLEFSSLGYLNGTLTSLVEGFLTSEADAETKINKKGSEDAMRRMPASDCSASAVASATAVKSGDNYVVTIVMKDQVNPSYDDTDGLGVMSKDFLDYKDVVETVESDATVKKVIKSIDNGEIKYKGYTITAAMTADGKFIGITHYCDAPFEADLNMVTGKTSVTGGLCFNAYYYDFVY